MLKKKKKKKRKEKPRVAQFIIVSAEEPETSINSHNGFVFKGRGILPPSPILYSKYKSNLVSGNTDY